MYYTKQLMRHVAKNTNELKLISQLLNQSYEDSEQKNLLMKGLDKVISDNNEIITEILEYDDIIEADDLIDLPE